VSVVEVVMSNRTEILSMAGEHLAMVSVAMAIATAIGVPLGLVVARKAKLGRLILGLTNVVQTVPSLALFGFLIPVPVLGGIGSRTAIVALTLYALLPIVRNTHAGLAAVDPAVLEAARGMGMTAAQVLWQVQMPLALGVILAGIRVAVVTSVGVATIAAAIGAGGLGTYIFRGLSMVNYQVILAGAIPVALLALLADGLLGWAERRLKRGR